MLKRFYRPNEVTVIYIGFDFENPLNSQLRTGSTKYSACPSSQRRKGKHLANKEFPRRQTSRNSHWLTADGAVHRPDGTPNTTVPHRMM